MRYTSLLACISLLVGFSSAQFGGQFFEQMFNGGGQQQQQPQNMASDAKWYGNNWDNAHCDKYLCPHTLSCVHFPHHCPCAFPDVEDKVELGDGSMICASKGGYRNGETARKIELARKGLI